MTAEVEVGVYGLRTFGVEELTGTLVPLNQPFTYARKREYFSTWSGGTCIARCWFHPAHDAPVDGCTCGIYCLQDLSDLQAQQRQAHGLVAVVALEGRVLEGERGWRAQAARVVALWAAPDVVTPQIRKRISRQIPGVRWLADLRETSEYTGVEYRPESIPVLDRYRLRLSIVFASPALAWPDLGYFKLSMKILRALYL